MTESANITIALQTKLLDIAAQLYIARGGEAVSAATPDRNRLYEATDAIEDAADLITLAATETFVSDAFAHAAAKYGCASVWISSAVENAVMPEESTTTEGVNNPGATGEGQQ